MACVEVDGTCNPAALPVHGAHWAGSPCTSITLAWMLQPVRDLARRGGRSLHRSVDRPHRDPALIVGTRYDPSTNYASAVS